MQAIVSVLDDPWRERVEEIWGELKAVFRLQDVIAANRPHFTYQWADAYDDGIAATLAGLATEMAPYRIRTHGLGIFRGDEAVVYLAMMRDDGIERVHGRLWRDAAVGGINVRGYYAPETWVPHITLAIGDLREEQLPDVVRFLGRKEYAWTIPVSNICLVPDTAKSERDWQRYELRGEG